MDFGAFNARLTYLLEGQTVKWARQDSPTHVTIQFENGPCLYLDILKDTVELGISIVDGQEASKAWMEKSESFDALPAPRRQPIK